MTLNRAWTLITCNRNDDRAFDDLDDRLRTLCSEASEASNACLYVPIYGQYDMLVGMEWDGDQNQLINAIQHVERCGEPRTGDGNLIFSTTTYTVLSPQEAVLRDKADWKKGYPLCVGLYVQPGQHEYVRNTLVNALKYRKVTPHVVDMVLGDFDVFVVLNVAKEQLGDLDTIWSAMRVSTKILKTVTFFSLDLIDALAEPHKKPEVVVRGRGRARKDNPAPRRPRDGA